MMKHDFGRKQRRSIRLKGYDYSQAGAYFVTICAQNRLPLLDNIGTWSMVEKWWNALPDKFPTVQTDQFIIMPNHIHGIIIIKSVEADQRVCPVHGQSHGIAPARHANNPVGADQCVCPDHGQSYGIAPTLGTIVQWFKTMTTNDNIRAVRMNIAEPFPGRLWQRNYYEYIIRNETDLNDIRQYIMDNPAKWEEDENNPRNFAAITAWQALPYKKQRSGEQIEAAR